MKKSTETLKKSQNKTLSQISSMWLDSKKPYVKESTYFNYLSIVRNHITDYFYTKSVSEIDNSDIDGFYLQIRLKTKSKTARDIMTVLKQIVFYADERGIAFKEPLKVLIPKATEQITKILSVNEQKKLEEYLKYKMDIEKFGIIFCLYTGLRLGEVCALQWQDFDFEAKSVKIRRTVQRIAKENGGTRFLMDLPKTRKSIREIPIPDAIFSYVDEFRCHDKSAYFLTGTHSFFQPRTYQNRFKSYLRECELSESFHFHTLRHTFASRATELGFDPKSLSEILGHANVNITLNRYVHSSLTQKRRNMALFHAL